MKEMFKNKIFLAALVVGLLLVAGVGYFVFGANSNKPVVEEEHSEEEGVHTMSPEEVGLSMEASPDKKKVRFKLAKASGFTHVEYELTYEADQSAAEIEEGGEAGGKTQKGIIGEEDFASGASTYETKWLDLGTCSRNICRYDTGVTEVKLILKLTKADGSIHQVEDTLAL
jgi:hypothetical protein